MADQAPAPPPGYPWEYEMMTILGAEEMNRGKFRDSSWISLQNFYYVKDSSKPWNEVLPNGYNGTNKFILYRWTRGYHADGQPRMSYFIIEGLVNWYEGGGNSPHDMYMKVFWNPTYAALAANKIDVQSMTTSSDVFSLIMGWLSDTIDKIKGLIKQIDDPQASGFKGSASDAFLRTLQNHQNTFSDLLSAMGHNDPANDWTTLLKGNADAAQKFLDAVRNAWSTFQQRPTPGQLIDRMMQSLEGSMDANNNYLHRMEQDHPGSHLAYGTIDVDKNWPVTIDFGNGETLQNLNLLAWDAFPVIDSKIKQIWDAGVTELDNAMHTAATDLRDSFKGSADKIFEPHDTVPLPMPTADSGTDGDGGSGAGGSGAGGGGGGEGDIGDGGLANLSKLFSTGGGNGAIGGGNGAIGGGSDAANGGTGDFLAGSGGAAGNFSTDSGGGSAASSFDTGADTGDDTALTGSDDVTSGGGSSFLGGLPSSSQNTGDDESTSGGSSGGGSDFDDFLDGGDTGGGQTAIGGTSGSGSGGGIVDPGSLDPGGIGSGTGSSASAPSSSFTAGGGTSAGGGLADTAASAGGGFGNFTGGYSAANPPPQNGFSVGALTSNPGAVGAGNADLSAAANASQPGYGGTPPMMPPMGGQGQPPKERDRTTWLAEEEEVWGTDPDLTPAVVGRGDADDELGSAEASPWAPDRRQQPSGPRTPGRTGGRGTGRG